MTAGTGIRHSEKNDRPAVNLDAGRPMDLIQMWVVPDEPEVTPGYEQLELDPADLQGQLAVVASGIERHRDRAAIRIRNRYAALHVARLSPGQSVAVPFRSYPRHRLTSTPKRRAARAPLTSTVTYRISIVTPARANDLPGP